MAYQLLTAFPPQFEDANGNPLSGGSLEFYIWNTSTPIALYSDDSGTSLGTSCTLNSLGKPRNSGGTAVQLFGDSTQTAGYKIVVKDADGAAVPPTLGRITTAQSSADIANTSDTALGDALVGVKQPYTGSVARTQHVKNTERVSVADFGALPDGSNATTAMNLAIAWANTLQASGQPATLYVPDGEYLITPGGLTPVCCDLDGPRAIFVASSNVLDSLLTIGVASGLSLAGRQKITLFALRGYDFEYNFTGTRYGYGIGFDATAGQFIAQLDVDIGFIEGFVAGINGDCSSGFHIGTNEFNIGNVWYCTLGIKGISGDLQFENNTFNVRYAVACNTFSYLSSTGTEHCCQNIFNVEVLELHTIANNGGIAMDGANTNQNIYNIYSIYYNSNTQWIVYTDNLPWGNVYNLAGFDDAKVSFSNDIIRNNMGPLNDSGMTRSARSVVYGPAASKAYPARTGDRHIVNEPSGYGAGSYVYVGGAWVVETTVGNTLPSSFTPTVSAGSGTFTTASAAIKYNVSNGLLSFTATVTITTNGTASGYVAITLPAAPIQDDTCYGRADLVSGKMLQGKIVSGGGLRIYNYDSTYPGANGETLIVSGAYFLA